MIGTKEAATQAGVSERRIQKLCADGRVIGAKLTSGVWMIPEPVRVKAAPRRTRPSTIKYAE